MTLFEWFLTLATSLSMGGIIMVPLIVDWESERRLRREFEAHEEAMFRAAGRSLPVHPSLRKRPSLPTMKAES